MKQSKPIPRMSAKRLASLGNKMPRSTIQKKSKDTDEGKTKKGQQQAPRTRIRATNPVATAKRKARYRKMLASPEYKAAKKEALRRAGNQCEFFVRTTIRSVPVIVPEGCGISDARVEYHEHERCPETESLHAHHKTYPKTRPLVASDLKILCKPHHEMAEAAKPHKTRMF